MTQRRYQPEPPKGNELKQWAEGETCKRGHLRAQYMWVSETTGKQACNACKILEKERRRHGGDPTIPAQRYEVAPVTELAWAAGFFDGEGTTTTHMDKRSNHRGMRLMISQVHKGPLERFAKALGLPHGYYYDTHRPTAFNSQPIWRLQMNNFERVQMAVILMWPYLCEPKRDQARWSLLTMRDYQRTVRPWRRTRSVRVAE